MHPEQIIPDQEEAPPQQTVPPVTQINYTAPREEERSSRSMKGSAPEIFDGDRTKSETFIDQFDVYAKINRKNETMKEPYSRVLMAISFIKGKKVRDWARGRVLALDQEINNGTPHEDEKLWRDFADAFNEAFTDTTRAQDAYNKLKAFRMEGDDLDSYMSQHATLVRLSGWAPEGEAAIETFREGLKAPLLLAIMKRDNQPETLKEWKEAAIIEQKKWKNIRATGLLKKRGDKDDRAARIKAALEKRGKAKDPDAMDVDNTRLAPLTEEERRQLMKEGRCFKCRAQGHLSHACTNKNGYKGSNQQPRTRVNEVVDDRDDQSETSTTSSRGRSTSSRTSSSSRTSTSDRSTKLNTLKMSGDEVIRALEGLTKEERGDVLDQILLKGEDF